MIALGGIGGRFDHTMANINVLFKRPHGIHIYLYSNESLVALIPAVNMKKIWFGIRKIN